MQLIDAAKSGVWVADGQPTEWAPDQVLPVCRDVVLRCSLRHETHAAQVLLSSPRRAGSG